MLNKTESKIGLHVVADLHGASRLNDISLIEDTLRVCVQRMKATLLHVHVHQFVNGGVSGLALLAESHISIHTWPEWQFAAFDAFTCGSSDPSVCFPILKTAFEPLTMSVGQLERGAQMSSGWAILDPGNARRTWVSEQLFDEKGVRLSLEVQELICKSRTEFQQLLVFEHKALGKVLMLDGATQLTTKDEFIYHEMMSHVPILAHGNVKNVLVVGGGDCGTAEEVLKHSTIANVTLVEIDLAVVEAARSHFAEMNAAVFSDPRFELVARDASEYVVSTDKRFDVIIVDSTDPQGPARPLFTSEFYSACKSCLTKGGVIVTQNGVPFFQMEELLQTLRNLKALFVDAACYVLATPTYLGGHMAISWASDDPNLRSCSAETIRSRYKLGGSFRTKYWTPAVHCAAFALPRYIEERVYSLGADGAGESKMITYKGSCLCGEIAYATTGRPTFPHLCSCRMCQRWSGAPTMGWLEFPLSKFDWVGPGGEPKLYRSSKKSQRGFCPTCGSSICIVDDGYDKISIPIVSLDDPSSIVPGKQHSYRDAMPAWWSPRVKSKRPVKKNAARARLRASGS